MRHRRNVLSAARNIAAGDEKRRTRLKIQQQQEGVFFEAIELPFPFAALRSSFLSQDQYLLGNVVILYCTPEVFMHGGPSGHLSLFLSYCIVSPPHTRLFSSVDPLQRAEKSPVAMQNEATSRVYLSAFHIRPFHAYILILVKLRNIRSNIQFHILILLSLLQPW